MMDTMTNEQLVARIQAGVDTAENMLKLWQQNKGFLAKMANKYKSLAEFDDLMQEGYLGLNAAVEHYEALEGVSFLCYAAFWIKQAMQRYIERNSPVSIGLYSRIARYKRFVSWYELQYGKKPSERACCHFLDISLRQFRALEEAAYRVNIMWLDAPIGEEGEATLADMVPDTAESYSSVLDKLQQEELREVIWPLVDRLPGKQPGVIRMRYQEGLTLKETGERLGVGIEAARTCQAKALRELRKPSRAKLIKPFLDEYITARAYQGNGAGTFNRTRTSSTERVALRVTELDV